MTRRSVKARIRAALLVLVPAIFVAILAPRGSVLQMIALVVLLLSAVYLGVVWMMARKTR